MIIIFALIKVIVGDGSGCILNMRIYKIKIKNLITDLFYRLNPMSQSNATYIESHILRRFNVIKKVGSGAYGHVWKVQQKTTKKIYALKKIFDAFQHATDAQRTYREIEILKQTQHPNIIKLYDTLRADNNKDVYLVFQFMEADLHNVISEDILKDVHIRFIIYQMAKALKYLHTGFIIHRDLKPSNILVNSNCTIKLCDFGLVRSISSKTQSNPILTEGVATRWYRAPEVLLGSKSYSTPADIWSFGCIIYQVLAQKPLFAGNSTLDQLEKVCQFTGYPTEEDIKSMQSEVSKSMLKEIKLHIQSQSHLILKEIPPGFRDLIEKMVVFNPYKRITIEQILNHEVVKAFHKPQEEISCNKQITTSIDDNRKFTVDEYRKLIYGGASNADRSSMENSSTIIKCNSAKYIKKPSELTSSSNLSKTLNQKQKPQLTKKYSYDNLKNLNKSATQQKSSSLHNTNHNNHASSNLNGSLDNGLKKQQKQTLKYVRSAKEFLRNTNYQPNRSTLYSKKLNDSGQMNNKSTASLSNYIEENKEETQKNQLNSSIEANKSLNNINKITYVSKNFYSPKNYLQPSKSMSSHVTSTVNTGSIVNNTPASGTIWNSSKVLLNKDPKDNKAHLFKSQKYIRDFKAGSIINGTNDSALMVKKEEPK